MSTLPAEVRTPVLTHIAKAEAARAKELAAGMATGAKVALTARIDARAAQAARQMGLANFMKLPEAGKQRAEAKAALLALWRRWLQASNLPKTRGTELFCHEYNAGRIEVPAWVRETRPHVSPNSLDNWSKELSTEGLARLAGRAGHHRKGCGIIDTTPGLKDFVLGVLVEYPHVSAKVIMRGIKARFDASLHPSYRTLQRFLATWKEGNEQVFTAVINPDAWRSRFQSAAGSASENIVRLNQRWETDSTKGDLILADGQRHIIVGVIDVFSRRLKLHVSRTSSSAAVCSTLRRAMLDWGVPEVLVTDNGSDYVSHHVLRVVDALEIDHDLAPPFTPEHKPHIERVFGTFCRDLVELLPGYIGHSVADRKDIEARRSFAQRLMKQGGEPVEIRMMPEELQTFCDRWTDTVYAHDGHSGLNDRTPWEVAAAWTGPVQRIADERALDVLLAPAADGNGARTVTKKGIRLDNTYFNAAELGGLEGQDVTVLLDDADIGEVFVFDLDGNFVAKAVAPERTGISRTELAVARKAHQKEAVNAAKAELKAAAKRADTKNLVRDILMERGRAAGKVATLPRPATPYSTEALVQAGRAARAADPQAPIVSPTVAARREALRVAAETEQAKPAPVVQLETRETRFRRALAVQDASLAGTASAEDLAWLERYRKTPEFRSTSQTYADFGDAALTA
ncbi:Mu transposase C-terminal domain-containing protein [Nitrospirillum viridazoti]|uniref:Mu transposase C-terminal domain-containing protein n=2 Tax=Nitrospirillum viridazoti TaxID=3144925 RepID=UPI001647425D|nr:Mu transposase C-terminal domain-containing protein [Nitrospirillum amazonense]